MGGTFEQDDMDNWQECTDTSRGIVSRRVPINQTMGLGRDEFNEEFMAHTSENPVSELSHRSFYDHWARVMSAEEWSDV
jgi:hypothetical protein